MQTNSIVYILYYIACNSNILEMAQDRNMVPAADIVYAPSISVIDDDDDLELSSEVIWTFLGSLLIRL